MYSSSSTGAVFRFICRAESVELARRGEPDASSMTSSMSWSSWSSCCDDELCCMSKSPSSDTLSPLGSSLADRRSSSFSWTWLKEPLVAGSGDGERLAIDGSGVAEIASSACRLLETKVESTASSGDKCPLVGPPMAGADIAAVIPKAVCGRERRQRQAAKGMGFTRMLSHQTELCDDIPMVEGRTIRFSGM